MPVLHFLKDSLAATSMVATGGFAFPRRSRPKERPVSDDELKEILRKPVLKRARFRDPILIESLDLLKHGS